MAFSFRHLTLLLPGLLASVLHAQPVAAPEPPPAVFQLFCVMPVADMLYDLKGKAVPVSVGQNSYSQSYTTPAGGSLSLYRLVPASAPDLPPVREVVATASIADDRGVVSLVVLYPEGPPKAFDENTPPGPLNTLVLDNSLKAYPPGTARIVTFSSRPVVIKIGTTTVQLTPFTPSLTPYPSGDRTWLQVATTGDQGWKRVIGTPQMLDPHTRLSLFMSDIPPSRNDPKPIGLSLKKIIEAIPHEESAPAAIGAATLTRR
jgi:hypothetical protein